MAKREVKKPKEDLAPAYFTQYAALWCILLGFFVMLLSLGNTQTGPGTAGVGEVRDAFQGVGGLGMLPFSKNSLFRKGGGGGSSFRINRSVMPREYNIDGYIRGMFSQKGLSNIAIGVIKEDSGAVKVVLSVPVEYRDDMHLEPDSVQLLEVLSEVIFNLSNHEFEIMAFCQDDANLEVCQKRAMLRSAVVARFLTDVCALPSERVHAVGYSSTHFLRQYGMEDVKGKVLICIQ
jgi:hypothetical protein